MNALGKPALADVLDMLLAGHEAPRPSAVAEFARRYPALRSDLVRFAAAWGQEEHLPQPISLEPDEEAEVLARAWRSFEVAVIEQGRSASSALAQRRSLHDLARMSNVTLGDVAVAAGLDLPLVVKLSRRGIRPETVRRRVTQAIARFLSVDVQAVLDSLTGPPLISGASFLALEGIGAIEQEDFAAAVASSGGMTPAQKLAALRDD